VLFLLGAQDQMTMAKSAQLLIDKADSTGKDFSVVRLAVGHHQMTEAPEETLMAIKDFLK
jgi:esterase/lipase